MPESPSRVARRLLQLAAVCAAVALAPAARAQEPIGKPLIHNFERADVVSELQHWAVAQDARGVMFRHTDYSDFDAELAFERLVRDYAQPRSTIAP